MIHFFIDIYSERCYSNSVEQLFYIWMKGEEETPMQF